jgi:group I intron endonuclease
MPIYKALLKYGYAEFRLEILEYCSAEKLIKTEQFYFDKFNPEYNVLKFAYSPLGYRHSEPAKKLIGLASKNRHVAESTRDLIREALVGKVFDKERLEKMRMANLLRQPVLITNSETGDKQEFSSLTDAGAYLGISRVSVKKYLLSDIPYKGYTFSIDLSDGKETAVLPPTSNYTKQQAILLTNKITGISKEFSSITEAAEYLNVPRARL